MRNEEILLSNYDLIHKLLNAGFDIKEIVGEVNKYLQLKITYWQLVYFIRRVKANTIHKEYNHIVAIDNLRDALDKKLSEYCVDFKGLLITYKSNAHLTNPGFIITPKNITTVYSQNSLLYAKRILKLYHISDVELLQQHKTIYPKQPDIDLKKATYKINADFNNEFATMLIELRGKYMHFITNNIIRSNSHE